MKFPHRFDPRFSEAEKQAQDQLELDLGDDDIIVTYDDLIGMHHQELMVIYELTPALLGREI